VRGTRRAGPDASDDVVANSVETIDRQVRGGRVMTARVGKMAPRVDRSLSRPSSGRMTSAGRALAVGLLCFAIWTLFDANQLYHNALTSPVGTRRSVSMSILRPIAAVANALGLSGPVNAADSALGRDNNSSAPPPLVPPAGAASRSLGDVDGFGMAPRPHTSLVGASGPGSLTSTWPPPIPPPTRSHPLVLLDIGDSIGVDLGLGLGDVFVNDPYVRLLQKGVIDTGLARPDYFNWPAHLASYLRTYHPEAVVVMMGANDDQAMLSASGAAVEPGTAEWDRLYRARIRLVMQEAVDAGAHVLWVGLPPLAGTAVNSAFAIKVNAMAQQEASSISGVTYYSSWSVLAGPHGSFVQYKRIGGNVLQIRYSDGVHLAPSGYDLLASALLAPMERAWHVSLHAAPLLQLP